MIETEIARPRRRCSHTSPNRPSTRPWQAITIPAVAEDNWATRRWDALREAYRALGGKQLPSLVEVSEYEPDRVLALRYSWRVSSADAAPSAPTAARPWPCSAPARGDPQMLVSRGS